MSLPSCVMSSVGSFTVSEALPASDITESTLMTNFLGSSLMLSPSKSVTVTKFEKVDVNGGTAVDRLEQVEGGVARRRRHRQGKDRGGAGGAEVVWPSGHHGDLHAVIGQRADIARYRGRQFPDAGN